MAVRKRAGSTIRPGGGTGDKADHLNSLRLPAPRLARGILVATLLSYVHVTAINLLEVGLQGAALPLSLVGLALNSVIQFIHTAPNAQRRLGRRKYLTLGIQAMVTYLPIVAYGHWWGSMAGFLAGSLLLLLPPRPAWALYGAVGASM
ncbi:hypothetical protein VR41_14340, partial [Streptomyces sp. NRRL B-1568]